MTALCKKEKYWFLDTLSTVHVGRDNTRGLTVVEQVMPRGFAPPLHWHRDEDVIFHVLAGEARFVIGFEDIQVGAGDTVIVPRGMTYTFMVTSADGARWLNLTNGGGFERMLRTVSCKAGRDTLPPSAGSPTPQQIAALEAACRDNGIEFAGPPLSAPVDVRAYA